MTGGSARLQGRPRRLLGVVAAAAGRRGRGRVRFQPVGIKQRSQAGGPVTLEFAQWWEPELPAGSFEKIMTDFTAQNPNIKVKLLSGPYASTKQQTGVRSGVADPARRRRPRRRLGERLRQAGCDHRPVRADDGREVRPEPAGQPDQGQRQDLHDPGRELRLPAVRRTTDLLAKAGVRRRRARAPSSWTRPRRSRRSAATSRAGRCRCHRERPTASRTTSCRGCGRPAGACSRTASPT